MLISDKMSTAAMALTVAKRPPTTRNTGTFIPRGFYEKPPRAVGAALAPDELADFGREHKALLERNALKRFRRAALR